MTAVESLVRRLREAGLTLATAESLTGGRVCAALIDVPGASSVVSGGIVAYTGHAKRDVLSIDETEIAAHGTVSWQIAERMAQAARTSFTTTLAVATTGVAGPDASEGKPVGRVHIAVAGPRHTHHRRLDVPGGREHVRSQTVDASVQLLAVILGNNSDSDDVDANGYEDSEWRCP